MRLRSAFSKCVLGVWRSADEKLLFSGRENILQNILPFRKFSTESIQNNAYTMSAPVADYSAVSLYKPIGNLKSDTVRQGLSDGLRCPIQTSRSAHVSDFRNVAVQCVGSRLGRHVTTRFPSTSRTCGQIRANSSSVSTDSGSATPSSEVIKSKSYSHLISLY